MDPSNKKGIDEQTLASFGIGPELWQRFQARCVERETTTAEVLSELILEYVEERNADYRQTAAQNYPLNLDEIFAEKVRELVEDYLDQNIETRLLNNLEHRLNPLIQQAIEERFQSEPVETPTTPAGERPQPPPPAEKTDADTLKSAKELAEILGVSAPYITTLNRIGELQVRGWEDSGKRRGKTILYKPVD